MSKQAGKALVKATAAGPKLTLAAIKAMAELAKKAAGK